MNYIRYLSDIHLDHHYKDIPDMDSMWKIPPMPEDLETCLVIAGDLWTDAKFLKKLDSTNTSWIGHCSAQFKYVVFVLGNHDYWDARLDTEVSKCREFINKQGLHNVFLLDADSVDLDQVRFVGGTLWTDYGNRNPLSMLAATNFMSDYRKIKFGVPYRKVKPDDMLEVFDKTKEVIFNTKSEGKLLVVVTHMAPSYKSVNYKYQNTLDEQANTWYYSNLDNDIIDSDISYWIHGHMHDCSDYFIGKTNVLCNPKGYYRYEDTQYDVYARIELPCEIF